MQKSKRQEQHVDALLLQVRLGLGVYLEQIQEQALLRKRCLQSAVGMPGNRRRRIFRAAVRAPVNAFELVQQLQRRFILRDHCLVLRALGTGDLPQALLRHVRERHRFALAVQQLEYFVRTLINHLQALGRRIEADHVVAKADIEQVLSAAQKLLPGFYFRHAKRISLVIACVRVRKSTSSGIRREKWHQGPSPSFFGISILTPPGIVV